MVAANRRELILYATPLGELAEQCDRYFDAARRLGPTAAQAYPPHCTLTGFFRREPSRAAEIVVEMRTKLDDVVVPDDAVEVVRLSAVDAWVGLEIRSPWLEATTRQVVDGDGLAGGDDPIRCKTDLHLSLAYGVGSVRRDLAPYADLARRTVDATAPASWQVALWERTARGWIRLS